MPSYADRKATALASLPTSVAQVFNDAQKPNSNQRKHAIALRKIQEQCTLNRPLVESDGQHDIDPEGELAFNQAVIQCINRILQIRKREPHADRITRFIANFLQYTQQLDSKKSPEDEEEQKEQQEEGEESRETISSHFAEYLLRHLLRGLTAKNKPVRLRCCEIIALSITALGEIDEELYQELRRALFERIKDKEISVRIQAATALARLQDADDEVDEKDGKTITQKLLTLLQHDPSPEVRRVVLFNLDTTQETIPYIIERARDVDAISRRVVFLKPMAEIEDFRILTVKQRHNLLKWGLNDRDPLVRKAATKLISTHWIKHADNNLLEFLERMDVVEGGAAEDILMAFFGARMDIVNSIKFEDQFWDNLSPESAFMAKVFIKFLKSNNLDEKLDSILPEVTRHAFYIETYNDLWQQAPKETEGDYEFVVGQLLDIAKCLDYADEVGRRKMFVLLRQILIAPDIPDHHLICTVELFKIISLDERDFTRTMIEIIFDIQEQAEGDEGLDMDGDATPKRAKLSDGSSMKREDSEEQQTRGLQTMLSRLKCLAICRHMLERSEESLQDNSSLYGLLNELIVPAVQSKESVLREEGLHCMGLCCLLDKSLGLHNISLFTQCLRNGHEELQQKGLMILFDLMMNYGFTTVQSKFDNPAELTEIFELCLDHDSPVIQSITVEGLAKLMLARLYREEDILKLMILLYFFPSTVDNLKIQQCLSYFFPVFCYSSPENQACLAKVAVSALQELCETYADLEQDEEMVSPSHIADMLADWTDPRKIATTKLSEAEKQKIDMGIQGDMTLEILKAIYRNTGLTRKTMCHMLLKMYIAEAGDERLEKMLLLTEHIEKEKPIKEAAVRNSFNRFVKSISKYISRVDGQGASVDGSVEPEAEADEEDTATVATAATGTTNE